MPVPRHPDEEYVETLNRAQLEARQLTLTLEKLFALHECHTNGVRYHETMDLRNALYRDWLTALDHAGRKPADEWTGWLPGASTHIPPKGGGPGMWLRRRGGRRS